MTAQPLTPGTAECPEHGLLQTAPDEWPYRPPGYYCPIDEGFRRFCYRVPGHPGAHMACCAAWGAGEHATLRTALVPDNLLLGAREPYIDTERERRGRRPSARERAAERIERVATAPGGNDAAPLLPIGPLPCTCPGCPRDADLSGGHHPRGAPFAYCVPCADDNHGHAGPVDRPFLRVVLDPEGYAVDWHGVPDATTGKRPYRRLSGPHPSAEAARAQYATAPLPDGAVVIL